MPKMPNPSTKDCHKSNGHAKGNHLPLVPENRIAKATTGVPVPGGITNELPEPGPGPLAFDPQLIKTIQKDLVGIGLVGEQDAGMLAYIVGSSRLLKKPAAIVIRGRSSSGKSHLQRLTMELFPPELIIDATSITPAALYRLPPDSLHNKILVTGERKHRDDEAAADANAALRQLLSEGRISKLCPIKLENGNFETSLLVQEGPVAYLETTTAASIFQEDLNRMIQITTDESTSQTRAIMKAVAQKYSFDGAEIDRASIIQQHWQFQRALQPCDIRIPYAGVLAEKIPASKIESRRVISQVLSIIEAIVLLHQFQRKKDEYGRLCATTEDYEVTRRLLLGSIHAAIGLGGKYQKFELLRKKLPNKTFDANQAYGAGGFTSRMSRDRTLKELVEIGVVECVEKGTSHSPSCWKWTGKNVDEVVLPSVKTIS